jgi:hypothetical protein
MSFARAASRYKPWATTGVGVADLAPRHPALDLTGGMVPGSRDWTICNIPLTVDILLHGDRPKSSSPGIVRCPSSQSTSTTNPPQRRKKGRYSLPVDWSGALAFGVQVSR